MAAKNIKSDDLILVNRGGVDYQAKVSDLPHIERWTAPKEPKEVPSALAPFAVGDSSCRPGYWKYSVKGVPHDIKLEDGSFGYIMPVVCGGGNTSSHTSSLLIVNKKLEEQKIMQLPNDSGLLNGGHIMCYPYLDKYYSDYGQPALDFNNILVWSDSTGVWGSFDYGDSWTQFKGYNGDSWIPTDDNCRLAFTVDSGNVERSYIRLDGTQMAFTGITQKFVRLNLQLLGDAPRGCGIGLEGLLHTDLLDMSDPEGVFDYTREEESNKTFPESHAVMSWHYEISAYFRTEEEKLSNKSSLKSCKIIHCNSTGAEWKKGDSKDDIFDIYVTEFGVGKMGNWKADFHKRWIRSIPDHDLKDDAKIFPEFFLLSWDPETNGYFSRYHSSRIFEGEYEDSRQVAIQLLWTSSTLQDSVVAYHSSAPFLDGESADTRNGESIGSDPDEYGCWITRLGTSALMRFGSNYGWRLVDAPVKGQEDNWNRNYFLNPDEGSAADWVIPLPDKRLWSGETVTTDPIYSMKDGYLIEGEFIEAVYPEAAQMFHSTLLTGVPDPFPEAPADGNVYVRNGQSKSWIRGLPYDARTLTELP